MNDNSFKADRQPAGETFLKASGIDLKLNNATVLDHVDLEIKRGELLAIIGGNGAGKSSLLRCLSGMWLPDKGKIMVDGLDRFKDDYSIRKISAYMPPDSELPSDSIRNNLRIFAEAYGIKESDYRDRMDSLLRMFNLKEKQDKSTAYLSKGEKKKTILACVLISGAEFYIFDEPFTDGIDPQGYNALREVMLKLAENRNITVVFATQILELATSLADRIAVVNHGRVQAIGTVEELHERANLPQEADFKEVYLKLASRDSDVPVNDFINIIGSK